MSNSLEQKGESDKEFHSRYQYYLSHTDYYQQQEEDAFNEISNEEYRNYLRKKIAEESEEEWSAQESTSHNSTIHYPAEDWGETFDDHDSGFWEEHMSGPED